jgi:hypothetical protein
MKASELAKILNKTPDDAEIVISGYGTPLPSLIAHNAHIHDGRVFLSVCTPETAEEDARVLRNLGLT